jgi:hypothetical protein
MKFLYVKMIYNTVLYDDFSTLHCKFIYFVYLWLVTHPTVFMTHLWIRVMYVYVCIVPTPTRVNSSHFLERSSSLCDAHIRIKYSYSASCHCNFLASSLYWLFYIIATKIFFAFFLFLCPWIVTSSVRCLLWLVYVLCGDITHVTSEHLLHLFYASSTIYFSLCIFPWFRNGTIRVSILRALHYYFIITRYFVF